MSHDPWRLTREEKDLGAKEEHLTDLLYIIHENIEDGDDEQSFWVFMNSEGMWVRKTTLEKVVEGTPSLEGKYPIYGAYICTYNFPPIKVATLFLDLGEGLEKSTHVPPFEKVVWDYRRGSPKNIK